MLVDTLWSILAAALPTIITRAEHDHHQSSKTVFTTAVHCVRIAFQCHDVF